MGKTRFYQNLLQFLLYVLVLGAISCGPPRCGPARIALLLPPQTESNKDDNVQKAVLWARDVVNQAGGAAGRQFIIDSYQVNGSENNNNSVQLAKQIVSNGSYVGVIAAIQSNDMDDVAPIFANSEIVTITPSATYAELFRAFKGQNIWRTVPSDVAQTKVLLDIAKDKLAVKKVGLIATSNTSQTTQMPASTLSAQRYGDRYGESFFDWFGFWVIESGLEATNPVRFDPNQANNDCKALLECAVGLTPSCQEGAVDFTSLASAVIVATQTIEDAECIIKAKAAVEEDVQKTDPAYKLQLLVSDSVAPYLLLQDLGADAEGVMGTEPEAWPQQGDAFYAAYQKQTGDEDLPRYTAQAFDAVLLLAYGLSLSHGAPGAELNDAIKSVVKNQGAQMTWLQAADAMNAIKAGQTPWVTGAGSCLRYDRVDDTDLTCGTYRYWQIVSGDVKTLDDIAVSQDATSGELTDSLSNTSPSGKPQVENGPAPLTSPKTGDWAFIMAYSFGYENYRHQADALQQYQLVRDGGIPEDHIVLMYADDIANNPQNPKKGQIFNAVDGANLYQAGLNSYQTCIPKFSKSDVVTGGSEPNASGEECAPNLSVAEILGILSGTPVQSKCINGRPCAINSGEGDNVYVFLDGHGNQNGLYVNYGYPPSSLMGAEEQAQVLGASDFSATLQAMNEANKYRQMLVVIEACESGTMGTQINDTTPNVLMLTAASAIESSFAANYSDALNTFLANQFSRNYASSYIANGNIDLLAMYLAVYGGVVGSHPQIFGSKNFAGLDTSQVYQFMSTR